MDFKHDEVNRIFYFGEDGKRGRLTYQKINKNLLDYQSTFVDEDIRGEGYGKALVKYALEYAKENNYKIIPSCRMVSTYLDRNEEYKTLVEN